MTPEEINIAIAEACGWKYIHQCTCSPQRHRGLSPDERDSENEKHLPNYYADLNACTEVEETLTPNECYQFNEYLSRSLGQWEPRKGALNWPFHATAPQCCEAFLRVKGLWKD